MDVALDVDVDVYAIKNKWWEKMENLLLKMLLKWFFSQRGNEARKGRKTNNRHEKWNIVVLFLLGWNNIDMVLKQIREGYREKEVIVRFWNESLIEFSCEIFYENVLPKNDTWFFSDDEIYFLSNVHGISYNLLEER